MPVEPRLQREPLDGALSGRSSIGRARGQDLHDRLGKRLGRRGLVALPALRMRNPDPGLVTHELHRAAARRIDHGEPACHRLDHRTWARILDLGVQEEMSAPKELGCITLRVPADELDTAVESELVDQRVHGRHEPPSHEQLRVGRGGEDDGERPQRELEPVLLRLVTSEQEDRTVRGRRLPPA